MINFLADEDFSRVVVHGLRRRSPILQILTIQELDLYGSPDEYILEYASDHNLIVLSHDKSTMTAIANRRILDGKPMPGLIIVDQSVPTSIAIDEIVFIGEAADEDYLKNHVKYLPLQK